MSGPADPGRGHRGAGEKADTETARRHFAGHAVRGKVRDEPGGGGRMFSGGVLEGDHARRIQPTADFADRKGGGVE